MTTNRNIDFRGKVSWTICFGTIDSEDYEVTPDIVKALEHSLIPNYYSNVLKSKNNYIFHEFEEPEDDSKFYSKEKLLKVLDEIKNQYDAGCRDFIVSFGTDAMIRFARLAKDYFDKHNMNDAGLVITGAMDPLIRTFNGKTSDATLNLDFIDKELSSKTGLCRGVHIVMDGEYIVPEIAVKLPDSKKIVMIKDPERLRKLQAAHEEHFGNKFNLYSF